ncbi:MAG: PAS domain S-box protein, partial [Acidobacteriaceae bacterium]|nr:PAS domain S-box protein [Acidobacteriaceae bacterium]
MLAGAHRIGEVAEALLESLANHLGWSVGFLWLRDAKDDVLRCATSWRAAGVEVPQFEKATLANRFARGIGLPGRVWELKQAVWIPDVSAELGLPRHADALQDKLRGGVAFPILDRGELVGVMEFFVQAAREPDADLLDTLLSIGHQIGHFIERSRGEEALRASENLKTAILESALDCIITIDVESRVIEWNPAAERVFGYRRTDVIGRSLPELIIPPAFRPAHYDGMRRYVETGAGPILGRRIELTGMRADGSEFPIELAVTRLPHEEPPLFSAYLRDLSERVRHERALQRSERRYQALFENVLEGVYQSDPNGKILAANPALARMLGFESAEQLLETADIPKLYANPADRRTRLQELERESELRNAELKLRRRDGSEIVVLENTRAVRDDEGCVMFYEGTLTDITDRKRAEEELRAAKEAAEFANHAKSDFLAN